MTEKDLDDALMVLSKAIREQDSVRLKPTKLYIPRYDGDSDKEYAARVALARLLIAKAGYGGEEKK